jgi:hypothetical protein
MKVFYYGKTTRAEVVAELAKYSSVRLHEADHWEDDIYLTYVFNHNDPDDYFFRTYCFENDILYKVITE